MLYSSVTPAAKRSHLRDLIAAPGPLVLPGAFNALTARLLEREGCPGVYVSGHMIAADLGLPDLGMTSISEVAIHAQRIARVVDLPTIVDADTGFGEPLNAARSIQALEDAGLAGCHIEDQVNPKRCGHSEGVDVVDRDVAVRRIRAAVRARRDDDFVIIARTDARAVHGLDEAVLRAQMFVDAGADVVFAEALEGVGEYEAFRRAVAAPLMVNLNEFGRGLPLTVSQVHDLGIDVAIYPMTLLRLAMGAVARGLAVLQEEGSQRSFMPEMQTKDELYDLLGYDEYTAFDNAVFTGGA